MIHTTIKNATAVNTINVQSKHISHMQTTVLRDILLSALYMPDSSIRKELSIGVSETIMSIRGSGYQFPNSYDISHAADEVLLVKFHTDHARDDYRYVNGSIIEERHSNDTAQPGFLIRMTWGRELPWGMIVSSDVAAFLVSSALHELGVNPESWPTVFYNGELIDPNLNYIKALPERAFRVFQSRDLAYRLRFDPKYDFAGDQEAPQPNRAWRRTFDLYDKYDFALDDLVKIVFGDKKGRYELSSDLQYIRARYGHGNRINTQVLYEVTDAPDYLYHGTSDLSIIGIRQDGLLKRKRQYVHLSVDRIAARKIGQRHGNPIVLTIDAKRMQADGYKFYKATDDTWLTECVPAHYISITPLWIEDVLNTPRGSDNE